jgi:hypothetical protein
MGPAAPPWPRVASLTTGQVTAMTVGFSGVRRRVVFLDPDLFSYAHLLSKAVALAVPIERVDAGGTGFALHDSAIDARAATAPEPSQRLFELVEAYAVRGNVRAAPRYVTAPEYDPLHSGLTQGMELFALAHEYGHVCLRHHSAAPAARRRTPAGVLDEIAYSWEQEYAADWLALPLAMTAGLGRVDPAVAFAGICLYLGGLELMDRAVSVLRTGRADAQTLGSHPPAPDRRRVFRERGLPELLQGAAEASDIARVADATEFALARMWDAIRPRLVELHHQGVTPAPAWG